jgi:uncharacterized RDD family membrane protein YckC
MSLYANIASRLIAGIIDFVITLAIALVFFLIVTGRSFRSLSTPWSLLGQPLSLVLFGLLSAVWIVYYTYFEGSSGQTLGKKFMNIKVVSETGFRCSMRQALARNILRILDFLPAYYIIGLISLISTKGKKRLGDILAKTVVVRSD